MRIDPEGRDITKMPGLHDDESDTIVDDAFAASVIVHCDLQGEIALAD